MCVFLVCVLVLFRASVCAFRASELLDVRLSFVEKLFRLRSLIWNFRVEFRIRLFRVEFRIRILSSILEFSKSYFEVEFRIRLFRFVALFDFSNFVALFDFSNFNFRFEFRFEFRIQVPWIFVSNLSSKFSFRCSIRFLEFRFSMSCSIRLLECRWAFRLLELRLLDSSALNFEFVLIYSTSRNWWFQSCRRNWWFQNCRRNCRFRVAFLIWVLRWTLQFSCLVVWKVQFLCYFSTDVSWFSIINIARFALVLPRELCARFSCVKY